MAEVVLLKKEEITTIIDALNCYIDPIEEDNIHKINILILIRYLQTKID